MSYDEIRMLLQMINIDLSDQYAHSLFQVIEQNKHTRAALDPQI